LKMHGGMKKSELSQENLTALDKGFTNLAKQVANMAQYGLPVLVGINKFISDTDAEIALLTKKCEEINVPVALNECWEKGGAGGIKMAKKVLALMEGPTPEYRPIYDVNQSISEKIDAIVQKIYGGDGAVIEAAAQKQITQLERLRLDKMPVCIAKTQYSLSDDPAKLGAPSNFKITVKDVRVCAGAGFIVCQTSNIMVMPGLPKVPAAENIDVDENGVISGLF